MAKSFNKPPRTGQKESDKSADQAPRGTRAHSSDFGMMERLDALTRDVAKLKLNEARLLSRLATVEHVQLSSPTTPSTVRMTPSPSSASDSSPTSAGRQGTVASSDGVASATSGAHPHTHEKNIVQLQIVPLGVAQQGETALESGAPVFSPNPGHRLVNSCFQTPVRKPGTRQPRVDAHRKHSGSPRGDVKQWLEARNAAPRAQQHRASTAAAPRYPAPHPLWQPISSAEVHAEDSSSSGYGTAPEPSSPINEALGARIKPDHEWRMGRLRWIRAVGERYRLVVRCIFRMWRRCTQDSDARSSAGSVSGASSKEKQNRRGRRAGQMHKPQRHADRQHPAKPAVSNGKPAHVSQDFPFANARGVCIKCGDGWLVGSWQRRPEFDLLPMANGSRLDKKFDELAGKRVCDSCHKKYPLAQHMFQMWKPEVTEESVKLVNRQAEAGYIDPAKTAATLFALSHSSDSSGSSDSDSSISSGGSTSIEPGGAHTVVATLLDGIFDAACSLVEKRAESAAAVGDVLESVVDAACTQAASRSEHARQIISSVIDDVFTEIDARAEKRLQISYSDAVAHQLATWYDPINFEYTCPSVSIDDLRSGGDERFYDFKNWKRVGPVCDAPNARCILADDVPGFLRNAKLDEWNLGHSCEVWVRLRNRDGVRTCFGSEYCLCVGAVRSHIFGGCKVRFEDLEAAYADLHAAEAGGAYLGCSICNSTCTCKRAHDEY